MPAGKSGYSRLQHALASATLPVKALGSFAQHGRIVRRVKRRWCAAWLGLALTAGCANRSSDGLGKVFPTTDPGQRLTTQVRVGQTVNLGLPTPVPLRVRVHLTGVSFVSKPPGASVKSIVAYRYSDTGGGILKAIGDLPRKDPSHFSPRPVTAVKMTPGRQSAWFILATLTWHTASPQVHMPAVRLAYEDSQGDHGSQVVPYPMTVTVVRSG
ncbi:MAG: hypothetical protein JO214_00370 [Frankiaceae bacterium]|nr:hypothetical protein [Frankiaceae bacterium]